MSESPAATSYAAFWLYKAAPEWRHIEQSVRAHFRDQFAEVLQRASSDVTLRGAYSLAGLRSDTDLMLWIHGADLAALQELAVSLRKTGLGAYLAQSYCYTGMVPQSRYAPEHRPAFTKGAPPREYLSMYPFIKTHEWYQLPFERRRELMGAHGRMGQKHSAMPEVRVESTHGSSDNGGVALAPAPAAAPSGQVLANTIHSFGLGDQEFVVAFESDDPAALVHMVEDLRAAEVRLYTSIDTPVFLGRRKSLSDALSDLG
jgi:peroxiredoxin